MMKRGNYQVQGMEAEAKRSGSAGRRPGFSERLQLVERAALRLFTFWVIGVILASGLQLRVLARSGALEPFIQGDSHYERLARAQMNDDSLVPLSSSRIPFQ